MLNSTRTFDISRRNDNCTRLMKQVRCFFGRSYVDAYVLNREPGSFTPSLKTNALPFDVETLRRGAVTRATSRTLFEIDGHPPLTRSKQPPSRAPYGVKARTTMGRSSSITFTPLGDPRHIRIITTESGRKTTKSRKSNESVTGPRDP